MGANYSGLIKVIFLCVFAAQPSSILLAQMIDREDRVLFQNARIVIGDGGIIENGSLFIETANPKAAVIPIKGAPLTFIFFIAIQKSLRFFNSIIENLNGNFV